MTEPFSFPPQPGASVQRTSGLAIASLILGILSFLLNIFASIPAIICGILALRNIRNSQGQLTGRGLAIAGIVIGATFTTLLPAIMLPALARARESARRASCANNLKQMGLIFKMFANESKGGVYPQLSSEQGRFMCTAKEVFPEYLTDPLVLICPSDPEAEEWAQRARTNSQEAIDDQSYAYLGYVITSDDEMAAFAEVYKERLAKGLTFNEDLKAPPKRGSMGSDTFYRLREGVGQLLPIDRNDPMANAKMQARIPIMWDKTKNSSKGLVFNHLPGGANVLFMDGHVEFLRYPGNWPLTKRAAEIIAELDALKSK